MNLDQVLEFLRAERDRYDAAIRQLEGKTPHPRASAPPPVHDAPAPTRRSTPAKPRLKTRIYVQQVFADYPGTPMTVRQLMTRLIEAGWVARTKDPARDLGTQLPRWQLIMPGLTRVPKTLPVQWVYHPGTTAQEAQKASRKAPTPTRVNGHSLTMGYLVRALQQAGKPIHYHELIPAMKALGWDTTSKRPEAVLAAGLGEWRKRDPRIRHVDKGIYVYDTARVPRSEVSRRHPVKQSVPTAQLITQILPKAPKGLTSQEAFQQLQAAGWQSNSAEPVRVVRMRLQEHPQVVLVSKMPSRWGLKAKEASA